MKRINKQVTKKRSWIKFTNKSWIIGRTLGFNSFPQKAQLFRSDRNSCRNWKKSKRARISWIPFSETVKIKKQETLVRVSTISYKTRLRVVCTESIDYKMIKFLKIVYVDCRWFIHYQVFEKKKEKKSQQQ